MLPVTNVTRSLNYSILLSCGLPSQNATDRGTQATETHHLLGLEAGRPRSIPLGWQRATFSLCPGVTERGGERD